jgi:hypothetical protein
MIRGKVLTETQLKNVTLPFKVQFTHLDCVSSGAFKHITYTIVLDLPYCHTWDSHFYVHPNVREDGWAEFLMFYIAALVKEVVIPEGLTAQDLDIQPMLWTSPDDKPSPYTCLPVMFKKWVEMAKRGEPLKALMPGPPGWNSYAQTPASGTSAHARSPPVSFGLSPIAHLPVVPEHMPSPVGTSKNLASSSSSLPPSACAPPLTSQRLASPPSSPVVCAPLPPSDDEYIGILDKTLSTEEMEEWKKADQKTA